MIDQEPQEIRIGSWILIRKHGELSVWIHDSEYRETERLTGFVDRASRMRELRRRRKYPDSCDELE